jgi:hypothetical protein
MIAGANLVCGLTERARCAPTGRVGSLSNSSLPGGGDAGASLWQRPKARTIHKRSLLMARTRPAARLDSARASCFIRVSWTTPDSSRAPVWRPLVRWIVGIRRPSRTEGSKLVGRPMRLDRLMCGRMILSGARHTHAQVSQGVAVDHSSAAGKNSRRLSLLLSSSFKAAHALIHQTLHWTVSFIQTGTI